MKNAGVNKAAKKTAPLKSEGDVVICVKRTGLESYGRNAAFVRLQKARDPRALHIEKSHTSHEQTVEELVTILDSAGVPYRFDDARANAEITDARLVVTVGGDGTLLLASHRVGPLVPVLGVNSAPLSSVGFFCAAKRGTVARPLLQALRGKLREVTLVRMQLTLNDALISARVLNDVLYCHTSPAATSRYTLTVRGQSKRASRETQRSSGVWVGPAAGSTAAQRSAGGRVLPWTSRSLQYVVREPYTPLGQRLRLKKGLIHEDGELTIDNEMTEATIFLDGPRRQFPVAFGDRLQMRRSPQSLTVLGLSRV